VQPEGFLWIDSTWQESHKMMRQSPWLRNIQRHSIKNTNSTFRLRRNQTQDGLSTLESLAYWLSEQNHHEQASALLQHFQNFQEAYLNARQDGLLK
jgi:DTW domain-containing protein YfiP